LGRDLGAGITVADDESAARLAFRLVGAPGGQLELTDNVVAQVNGSAMLRNPWA
jgi:hypothetical protein